MYCKNCGKEIDNDSKFCVNCGLKVSPKTKHKTTSEDKNSKTLPEPSRKTKKYDEEFKRNQDYTLAGIALTGLSIAAYLFFWALEGNRSEYLNALTVYAIISLLIRIFVARSVNRYARILNRNWLIWQLLAFFFPAISLLVIGQLKKRFIKPINEQVIPYNQTKMENNG